GVHFDQRGLAVEKVGLREIDDLEHLDDLVELLHDLLDDPVVADGDDRDHRGGRVQGGRDREAFYIITASAEKSRNSGKNAEFVFDEHRYDMFHPRKSSGRKNALPLIHLSLVCSAFLGDL